MERNESSIISYAESYKVAARKAIQFVLGQKDGLVPAWTNGHSIESDGEIDDMLQTHGTCGFLLDRRTQRRFFSRLLPRDPRWFIGTLVFMNKEKGVSGKEWLFEVYGRQHVPLVREIAENLSRQFDVGIHVRLDREDHQLEYLGW